MTDEIHWDCGDKNTGEPMARVIMKAGDMAAMPAYCRHQGFQPEALDVAGVGERLAEPGVRDPEGRELEIPVQF